MSGVEKKKKDLSNVLLYTQELFAVSDKIVFDLSDAPYPHFLEHQVSQLEGVTVNADGETWFKVERLREKSPPAPDPIFEGWVTFGPHASPDQPPKLTPERMLHLPIEEISELFEAGLVVDPDDVLTPLPADRPDAGTAGVILRVANMPEFQELWQQYLEGPWAEWAKHERPRRRSIDLYNKLYQIYQRMLSLGDDNPIELVFGVGIARWRRPDARLNVPLIEQQVELELESGGTILLRPRSVQPRFSLRAFHALEIEGSKSLQKDAAQQFDRLLEDPDVGFSPFVRSTFDVLLRTCAARLSSTGIYLPDVRKEVADRSLPEISDVLTISDTWVIYVRQRNEDFRKEDIQRLIKRIEEAKEDDDLPPAGRQFVEKPSDERIYEDAGTIDLTDTRLELPEETGGWKGPTSGSGSGGGGERRKDETFFFPLPYNDDQMEIIRRLEEPNTHGVLVQGPPGTGKTHTTANIICHYLATKRRVLVTAKTPEALTALQEKLPEGIRDLAIAVIHNDREGARQLEHAVQLLANEAKSINPKIVSEDIKGLQVRLAELNSAIQDIDKELYAHAARNLEKVTYGEEQTLPMALAELVSRDRSRHGWFEDQLTTAERFEPQFTDADIAEIEALRHELNGDLIYRADDLPHQRSLPSQSRVLSAHGELERINDIERRANAGQVPVMSLEVVNLDHAREVKFWLDDFAALMRDLASEAWLLAAYYSLIGVKRLDAQTITALRQALEAWVRLHDLGRRFSLRAVSVSDAPLDDHAFDKAVSELASGKKPFGLFGFLKGGLRAKIEKVTIEGRNPAATEDWIEIRAYREWQRETNTFLGRWSAIARVVGAPGLSSEDDLLRLGIFVEGLWRVLPEIERRRASLKSLFPYGIDIDEAIIHGRCDQALEALAANLEKAERADAHGLKRELAAVVGERNLPWHSAVGQVLQNLGSPGVKPAELAAAWSEISTEAQRLDGLRDKICRLDTLVGKVAASGAPNWAARMRNEVTSQTPWSAATWQETWRWARADGYVRSLSNRDRIRKLSERRAAAEAEQKKLFTEVVRLRTFLGLKQSLSAKVEAALAKFASAIARLGKGTGKAAPRHRRIIRESTLDTAQAVPCWILPEWRVSEQLPPELGTFDLVIIDEASQSDITALPAILRGKKVLIVGDDKQVSPTPVGLEERKIVQLRTTYLTGLPFADQMDPGTSLYELGGMIFPGKAIMLREHFRCAEPIIRFSSRFYPKPLVPLRVPTATERLDPPLIDIYVPHGRRHREVNEAEADVIVGEISKIVSDPTFKNRTIGVISLIGDKQAKKIYDRLMQELGAEVIERHHIKCGNAATYQGQERDIIFLSMVACPETTVSQTSRTFEQRFNVALSRARDRMVLVRSVTSSQLKPGDLKLAVIEHFRNPMEGGNVAQSHDILDLCESEFERDFGRRMLEIGYRIRPQVPVGGRRIDFVIEGHNDRRLAIELDGDKYHGPDRWADDIRRQKALERLGWTFWRCWGSSWIADRDGCLADLKVVLDRMGIEPIGAAPVNAVYTEHIVADSPEADGAIESDVEDVSPVAPETIADRDVSAREPDHQIHAVHADTTTLPDRTTSGNGKDATQHGLAARPRRARSREESEDGLVVEIGDLVVIRYNDAPGRQLRFQLSEFENRPNEGIVQVDSPIGEALLGASVDDEVDVVIGEKKVRTALIERIEKARDLNMTRS